MCYSNFFLTSVDSHLITNIFLINFLKWHFSFGTVSFLYYFFCPERFFKEGGQKYLHTANLVVVFSFDLYLTHFSSSFFFFNLRMIFWGDVVKERKSYTVGELKKFICWTVILTRICELLVRRV